MTAATTRRMPATVSRRRTSWSPGEDATRGVVGLARRLRMVEETGLRDEAGGLFLRHGLRGSGLTVGRGGRVVQGHGSLQCRRASRSLPPTRLPGTPASKGSRAPLCGAPVLSIMTLGPSCRGGRTRLIPLEPAPLSGTRSEVARRSIRRIAVASLLVLGGPQDVLSGEEPDQTARQENPHNDGHPHSYIHGLKLSTR